MCVGDMRYHELISSQIALLTQSHNVRHVDTKSAMKHPGIRPCILRFHNKGGTITSVEGNGVPTTRREEHNEYFNAFSSVFLLFLRSNHDVRFLVGSGLVDVLYYGLKYAANVQFDVD